MNYLTKSTKRARKHQPCRERQWRQRDRWVTGGLPRGTPQQSGRNPRQMRAICHGKGLPWRSLGKPIAEPVPLPDHAKVRGWLGADKTADAREKLPYDEGIRGWEE
jgi:hypothetical protein